MIVAAKPRISLGCLLLALGTLLAGCGKRGDWIEAIPPRPEFKTGSKALERSVIRAEERVRNGRNPRDSFAEIAALYYSNGYLDEAIEGYQALRLIDHRNARWPHLLGRILSGYGRSELARDLYVEAIGLDSDYEPSQLQLGEVLESSSAYDKAMEVYRSVLSGNAKSKYALLGMSRIMLERSDFVQANALADQALAIDQEFPQAWRVLANIYRRRGDDAALVEATEQRVKGIFVDADDPWYRETLAYCYDPYLLTVAAENSAALNDVESAIRLLKRAVVVAPDDALAHRQLGLSFVSVGNIQEAKAHLEKAVSLDRKDSENWIKLIGFYEKVGLTTDFESALASGLKSCPSSPSLHLRQARLYFSKGEYEKAIGSFQRSIVLRPEEVEAYMDLVVIYFRLGDLESAHEQLENALRVDPNHATALTFLARLAIGEFEREKVDPILDRVMEHESIPKTDKTMLQALYEQRFE